MGQGPAAPLAHNDAVGATGAFRADFKLPAAFACDKATLGSEGRPRRKMNARTNARGFSFVVN
jgi:hypothetical protein